MRHTWKKQGGLVLFTSQMKPPKHNQVVTNKKKKQSDENVYIRTNIESKIMVIISKLHPEE